MAKINFPRLTAEDIKTALLKKHPATSLKNTRKPIPGQWTCFQEYREIDFVAVSAHAAAIKDKDLIVRYPWIGYEIKVSRGDMRAELLKPSKRWKAKHICNQLYFAVPKGMLTKEEKIWQEPDWQAGDFTRGRCPAGCWQREIIEYRRGARKAYQRGYNLIKHKRRKSRFGSFKKIDTIIGEEIYSVITQQEVILGDFEYPTGEVWQDCLTCAGKGYQEKSVVEKTAPTLWIPQDVGLLEVAESGKTRIVKKAPLRSNQEWLSNLSAQELNNLLRWISLRPDPRHKDVIANLAKS